MKYETYRAGFIQIIRQQEPSALISGEIEMVIRQEYDRMLHVAKLEATLSSTKVSVFKQTSAAKMIHGHSSLNTTM